jgi:hypothetical protein
MLLKKKFHTVTCTVPVDIITSNQLKYFWKGCLIRMAFFIRLVSVLGRNRGAAEPSEREDVQKFVGALCQQTYYGNGGLLQLQRYAQFFGQLRFDHLVGSTYHLFSFFLFDLRRIRYHDPFCPGHVRCRCKSGT